MGNRMKTIIAPGPRVLFKIQAFPAGEGPAPTPPETETQARDHPVQIQSPRAAVTLVIVVKTNIKTEGEF